MVTLIGRARGAAAAENKGNTLVTVVASEPSPIERRVVRIKDGHLKLAREIWAKLDARGAYVPERDTRSIMCTLRPCEERAQEQRGEELGHCVRSPGYAPPAD